MKKPCFYPPRHVVTASATVSPPTRAAAAPAQEKAAPVLPFRVGYGFDLHRLVEGKKLIICGIDVPHVRGCDAHSDGESSIQHTAEARQGGLHSTLHIRAPDACHAVCDCLPELLLHSVHPPAVCCDYHGFIQKCSQHICLASEASSLAMQVT